MLPQVHEPLCTTTCRRCQTYSLGSHFVDSRCLRERHFGKQSTSTQQKPEVQRQFSCRSCSSPSTLLGWQSLSDPEGCFWLSPLRTHGMTNFSPSDGANRIRSIGSMTGEGSAWGSRGVERRYLTQPSSPDFREYLSPCRFCLSLPFTVAFPSFGNGTGLEMANPHQSEASPTVSG